LLVKEDKLNKKLVMPHQFCALWNLMKTML